MRLRIFTEPQQGATYDDLLAVASAAEGLGFEAFFRSDHYLTMGGDGLPGPTDAWTTLAGLARDTTTIRLGTLVSSATFRLPGPLAITVAQVDQMSGGRVELGLGSGWFAEEHVAYGIPFPPVGERFDRYEEQLAVIDGLWRTPPGQTFSHDGPHYPVSKAPALPKPVQSPRPPIIVGGSGRRRTPALAAGYADEFNVPFASLEDTGAQFDRVRGVVAESGRDAASMTYSAAQIVCVGRDDGELARRAEALGRSPDELRENGLGGSPAEVVDKIGRFAARGAGRLYLQFLDLGDLDQLELIATQIAPQV